jgi:hypothetical protein
MSVQKSDGTTRKARRVSCHADTFFFEGKQEGRAPTAKDKLKTLKGFQRQNTSREKGHRGEGSDRKIKQKED